MHLTSTSLAALALCAGLFSSAHSHAQPVLAALGASSQDPAPTPADKRADIKTSLEELDKHIDQRGKEDDAAVALIDKLLKEFPSCGPKDREAIAKGIAKAFEAKRTVSEGEEAGQVQRLYTAAVVSLGQMAPESVKPLTELIGHRLHRDNIDLQRRAILALGKTKDRASIKTLSQLLNHKEYHLQAAAAEALGEHADLPLDERKEVFATVLKRLQEVTSDKDADISDEVARERYDAVYGAMVTTLQRLSGHTERDPAEWQRWWNKNKKAEWPVG
jgi:HEAT repeat protein